MAERTKVESPFTMGPRPDARIQYKPDLASRAKPRSQFKAEPSQAQYIVDTLIDFAGVAGNAYAKQLDKKVSADKAIQTSRAIQGLTPTDEATMAGYKAHEVVAIQNQTEKSRARLIELSKRKHTEEEWEEAIQEEYRQMDSSMAEDYSLYPENLDMQKLAFTSLREMILQVTTQREANKAGIETEERIDAATDTLIVASKTFTKEPESIEALDKKINDTLSALKLTESQKDKVILNAIQNTKSPVLIELSKRYTGERKSSLFDRTGLIQSIERENADKALSVNAVELAKDQRRIKKSLIGDPITGEEPTMNENEVLSYIDRKNKQLNGKYMSTGQIKQMLNDRDQTIIAGYRTRKILQDITNPANSDLSLYKRKDVQRSFNQLYSSSLKRIEEESLKLPEDQRTDYIAEKRQGLIAEVGDLSIKSDNLLDSWVGEFHNLATLNIPAYVADKDFLDAKIELLPDFAQSAIEKLDNMTKMSQAEYIDSLDVKESKILKAFLDFKEMNIPAVQALDRAQRLALNPKAVDMKAVNKAFKEIRDDQSFLWWGDDFEESQIPYLQDEIKRKLRLDPNPESNRSIESIKTWMNNSWTNAGGIRLKGSPSQLTRFTGLHSSRLKGAIKSYIEDKESQVKPMLNNLGLTMDDVYPVTDPKRQTIQLRTVNGDWLGAPEPLSVLKPIMQRKKVEREKKLAEKIIELGVDFERSTLEKLYDERLNK
jgi:hypothetical protein